VIHPRHLEAARALRGRDIVVFSNDWDGDPLSKTHIMKILARDNRILWVNSVANRRPQASAADARRIAKKLADVARGITEPHPNLYVLGPLAIPAFGPIARRINRLIFRQQILVAMRKLGFRNPISWSFLPASAPVSGTLGEDLVVYHCVDEFSLFSGTPAEIKAMEEELARRADVVIVSAEKLAASKRAWNENLHVVRHGVDHRHFAKALDPFTVVPHELAALPRPVIGFFGLIADWVDLELIRAVADAFPHGSVVLLGKATAPLDALRGAHNVHHFGRRPYEELPAWCKGFDVALMPFVENELAANSNPLKVREYLAAGLPVVSTPVPEVERIGLCRIASGPQAFVEAVREALRDPGPSRARSAAVAHESWEAKVDEIRQAIFATYERRGGR